MLLNKHKKQTLNVPIREILRVVREKDQVPCKNSLTRETPTISVETSKLRRP